MGLLVLVFQICLFSLINGEVTDPHILILSGVHGDEMEGVFVSQRLIGEFQKKYDYQMALTIIPVFNPDGVLQRRRVNENQVDLNRNLPTKDWSKDYTQKKYYPGLRPNSEPENQALIKWMDAYSPRLIISIHSWKPMLNVNGDCQPEASILSQETRL